MTREMPRTRRAQGVVRNIAPPEWLLFLLSLLTCAILFL